MPVQRHKHGGLIQHKSTIISTNLNKEELRKQIFRPHNKQNIRRLLKAVLIFRGSDIENRK